MNFNAKILWYVNNRPHLCTHYPTLLFLSVCRWRTSQTSKTKFFLQQQNGNQGLFYPLIDKSTMPFLRNEIPCYLLKSPKTHAILGEYRVLSTVSLEKLRMKLHNYALLTSFLELALLSLLIKINISNYLKFISVIWRI